MFNLGGGGFPPWDPHYGFGPRVGHLLDNLLPPSIDPHYGFGPRVGSLPGGDPAERKGIDTNSLSNLLSNAVLVYNGESPIGFLIEGSGGLGVAVINGHVREVDTFGFVRDGDGNSLGMITENNITGTHLFTSFSAVFDPKPRP